MERRNYPLLIALVVYLAILTIIIARNITYIGFQEWLRYNGWTLVVAASVPILAIIAEVSGLFKGRPQWFVVFFIIFSLILLAIDFGVAGTYHSATFMFLFSIIIILIYILAMKMFIPTGEHFIIPIIVGSIFSVVSFSSFFNQSASSIIGAFWLGGLGIIMVGGFAALGHWKDRSLPYAIAGMSLSLLAVGLSFYLSVATVGF